MNGIRDAGKSANAGGKALLNLEQKKAIVAEVADVAASAQAAIAAEYRGLSVAEMTELRASARKEGVYLRIVRNTLARRAVEGTDYACLQEALVGPVVLAFSREDPASAARLIRDFTKEHEKLVVKAVALGGKLMDAAELKRLAEMPTREQAIAMLMGVMQAPATKFVRTLAEPANKLARVLAAVRDQKQAA
jgi:large subunit ribosomal protein L10